MCVVCSADEYAWPIMRSAEIDEAVVLIHKLYVDLGRGTGGPLHVILDDGNIYDRQFNEEPTWKKKVYSQERGWQDTNEPDDTPEVIECCQRIWALLEEMNEAQRASVLCWAFGKAHKYIEQVQDMDMLPVIEGN